MKTKPTFSIIIPTYNQAEFLGLALDSLLAQTDPDWEAIVVDDGSTDSTRAVIQNYQSKDNRIRSFYKSNGGTGSALNAGIQKATGRWICWLSSDDLFDNRKLEIHRHWINIEPDTLFFHTHFYTVEGTDGHFKTPPLWRSIPDQKWQLLEMFRTTFIHGLSVCIRRDAFQHVGLFDESLRYGQDYDMWVRLLAHYPATFIPVRTVIQREHSNQTTNSFPEACFFDSSRASINLLNSLKFEKIVPLIDLTDSKKAKLAIKKSLDVAKSFYSPFLYELGPHPLLLWRVVEWVLSLERNTDSCQLKNLVLREIRNVINNQNLNGAVKIYWKSTYAILRLGEGNFEYQHMLPEDIAKRHYWQLCAERVDRSKALHRYLLNLGIKFDSLKMNTHSVLHSREVIIVAQKGSIIDASIKYGSARAMMAVAKQLTLSGRNVLLVGFSKTRIGFTEGIQFIGVQSERDLFAVLKSMLPIDTLVGISRSDIFTMSKINKGLIYHHGPDPLMGNHSRKLIRKQKLPVVVVSKDSKEYQINNEIPHEQIRIIQNGYDSKLFKLNQDILRVDHLIVFAGTGIHYKGLDIAVRAFKILKEEFRDAEFYIYATRHSWLNYSDHYWSDNWVDADGYLVWPKIEQDVPGLKYYGEVKQEALAEAFQKASLLVMPSRINETFGIVSVEAQACGCIPVLPRKGGFPETMLENLTGYIYDCNNPEYLATVIDALWGNKLPSEKQRIKAAHWVRHTFSWQVSGDKFIEILECTPQRKNQFVHIHHLFWKTCHLIKQIAILFIRRIKSQ